ncbi:hypothetical protein [Streptomyces camelliae]|uniref:hypothetical protein n=1 Tax=Streptomyces camelliae TaxID=3004093 RepID=UPI002FD7E18C
MAEGNRLFLLSRLEMFRADVPRLDDVAGRVREVDLHGVGGFAAGFVGDRDQDSEYSAGLRSRHTCHGDLGECVASILDAFPICAAALLRWVSASTDASNSEARAEADDAAADAEARAELTAADAFEAIADGGVPEKDEAFGILEALGWGEEPACWPVPLPQPASALARRRLPRVPRSTIRRWPFTGPVSRLTGMLPAKG